MIDHYAFTLNEEKLDVKHEGPEFLKEKQQELDKQKSYYFNKIYLSESSNLEIYEEFIWPIVRNTFEGFNGTVFAYGQTSTGKTYTMTGSSSVIGLMEYTFWDLFLM